MAKVCRVTRDTTKHYQKAAFNINTSLFPFFDAIAFRILQARTQTLIGGNFVSDFLERSRPQHGNLNLLAFPAHCEEVGRWLLNNGYCFISVEAGSSFDSAISRAMSNTEDSLVIREVLVFHKTGPNTPSLTVSILVAVTNPLEIVFNSCASKHYADRSLIRKSDRPLPSACFFNVISWRRAYCVFPRATLHDRRVLLVDTQDGPLDLSLSPEIATHMQKNGLAVQDTLDPPEYLYPRTSSSFPLGSRFMMDSSSLSIELDVTDIAPTSRNTSSFPADDVISACGFRLRSDLTGRYWVDYTLVHTPALKYNCIMAENELLYQLIRALQPYSSKDTVSR